MIRTLLLFSALLISPFAYTLSQQGYFGAQLGPDESGQGITIVSALPDSPADKAGIMTDDVILSVDGQNFKDVELLAAYLRNAGAKTTVEVVLQRAATTHTKTLTLGINPWQGADQADPSPGMYKVTITQDLVYTLPDAEGSDLHERHVLDFYLPESDQPVPAMVWVHGGGWSFGDKTNERNLALRFAERGVAVAVINYRLSSGRWATDDAPEEGVTHPEHAKDVAAAFAWLHKHAAKYGLDTKRLYISGHSAGGHLAALLATDEQFLRAEGLSFDSLAGVLPIGGAYDIPDYHAALMASDPELGQAHIHAVFGNTKEQWEVASPTQFIHLSSLPMLVIVEEQAGFQRYANRLRLAAEAANRSNIEFLHAAGRTHGNILLLMSGRHKDVIRAQMITFMQNT